MNYLKTLIVSAQISLQLCVSIFTSAIVGLKTGINFEHFGLKLDMVIGGTFTKAYKFIFLPSNRGE